MSNNFLEAIHPLLLSRLFNLEIIHLERNRLKNIDDHLFHHSFNLRELYLNNNELTSLKGNLLKNLTKLEILNVSFNKIDTIDDKIFKELKNLKQILLNNNELNCLNDQIFLGAANLEKIALHSNNFITDQLQLSLEKSVKFISFKTDHCDNNIDSIIYAKIGDYKKMNCLGEGTFGIVYRVKKDDETYALKIIPYDVEKNCLEAKILSMSLNNPYIVKFIKCFLLDASHFCIVTEYCEDGDLELKILETKKSNLKINDFSIFIWCDQLLQGVTYLHANNIIHRDIKPGNILLKNDQVKLCDFGVSRELGSSIEVNTHAGTLLYMSPEIRAYKSYTYKTDVWSLGCVFYELKTLEKYTNQDSLLALDEPIKSILLVMLIESPEERFNSEDTLDLVKKVRILIEQETEEMIS